jgi:hypothetical protein
MASWSPATARVFIIGTLVWQDKKSLPPFDAAGRKDKEIFDFFKNAGVPAANMKYLCDKEAKNEAIMSSLSDFMTTANPDDTLFFYYCGHGYGAEETYYFASYDCDDVVKLPISYVVDTIDNCFPGKNAILLADCCHSGYLVKLAEEKAMQGSRLNYAAFSSVFYKAGSTGNWTFSSAVMDALRGEAFLELNGDGKVTLPELESHIQQDMALVEQQFGSSFIAPALKSFVLTGEVKPKSHKRIGEIVNVDYHGEDYLARIESFEGGTFGVRYFSYLNDESGYVSNKQLKPLKLTSYPIGLKMEAYSEEYETWYPCKIEKSLYGLHLIKYDDWDASFNEWMSVEHLRHVRK